MKFSKFSVVSVLSNWLYSPEQKPGNTGHFQTLEDWQFLGVSGACLKVFEIPLYWLLFWWHSILLYGIDVALMLVWNFQEKIYWVNIFLTFTTDQNIAYKSKQMPGGKLFRPAGTKFNFHHM